MWTSPQVVDWNNDGKKDLVTGSYDDGKILLFLNDGTDSSPSFSGSTEIEIGGFQFTTGTHTESCVEIVDWNNDGKKDILFAVQQYISSYASSGSYLYLALNTGSDSSPSFSTYEYLTAGGEEILHQEYIHPVVVDWNKDGKKDIVVTDRTNAYYYVNSGTDRSPALESKKKIEITSSSYWFIYLRPEVNDWNNDGHKDLLVGSYYGNVEYYLTTATGSYIIAYWDFDDGTGSTAEDTCSGGYHDITLYGAAWSTEATPVVGGSSALEFDGIDDYAMVGNSANADLSNFTVQMWICPDSEPSSACSVFAQGGTDSNSFTTLGLDSGGKLVLAVGGISNTLKTSASISTGSWTHIAGTYDGTIARVYTNGTLAGSLSISSPASSAGGDIIAGALTQSKGFFDGRMDDLKVFNYALSANDILEEGSVDVSMSILSAPNDYDGDGVSDLAIFDNSSGSWYVLSTAGDIIVWATAWGWDGADAVSGDYDGDGIDDLTVFDNNSGSWYVLSVSGSVLVWGTAWGWDGAVAMSGDYNGDGKDDLSVFDSNTGAWYILSVDDEILTWADSWGWPGAEPVSGDYDADGVSDLAVFDQNTGNWYVRSLDGTVITWAVSWGWPGAVPVSGDYNGDGKDDFAVFDSNTGNWYILSVDGDVIAWATAWGWVGAEPIPGDYNGDGVSDLTVFDQNSGLWYSFDLVSSSVLIWGTAWGWPGADVVAIN